MSKKFYAGVHAYDRRFTNDIYTIVRFDSRSARDGFINDEDPDRNSNFHREALTRDEARAIANKAFGPFAVTLDAVEPVANTEEAEEEASFENQVIRERALQSGFFPWMRYADGSEWYDTIQ
jgi:hypothetical protein